MWRDDMRSIDLMSRRKRSNSSFVSSMIHFIVQLKQKKQMERSDQEIRRKRWFWLRLSMESEGREELWKSWD
eukprot:9724879-Karenia_brevis.AAC.1